MSKGEAKLLTSREDLVSVIGREGLAGAALSEPDTAHTPTPIQNCGPLQLQNQHSRTINIKAQTLSTWIHRIRMPGGCNLPLHHTEIKPCLKSSRETETAFLQQLWPRESPPNVI